MATSLDLAPGAVRALPHPARRSDTSPRERSSSQPTSIGRFLPLALLATASIVVLPALLSATAVPRGGVLRALASVALAVAASLAIASAEAALWKRCRGSQDVLFADLMLWGWVRRYRSERRLARTRALYDVATRAAPAVSIDLLTTLSDLLEARDAYTHGHSQRVARHAERIARTMHLQADEVAKIRTAASVHDVGKLHTPRQILNNPRRLTQGEFEVMKRHAADGADMLASVGDPDIADIVRHHHERIDGSGYPDGLAGSEIPLGSRIIAVADTFDSITSNRAYRRASTQKKGLDVLSQEADLQLDAAAVAAFSQRYSARRPIAGLTFATALVQRAVGALLATSAGLASQVAGASSLLPALGAAGLLALSPALHHSPASAHASTGGVPAQARGFAVPRSSLTSPVARRRSSAGDARGNGPSRGTAHAAPRTDTTAPGGGGSLTASPGAPATGDSAGSQTAPPAAPEPPKSPAQPAPPTSAPPIAGVPPTPALPTIPPVTIPSVPVPSVPVPSIKTPAITVPSVTVPALATVSVHVPGVEVSGR